MLILLIFGRLGYRVDSSSCPTPADHENLVSMEPLKSNRALQLVSALDAQSATVVACPRTRKDGSSINLGNGQTTSD